MKLWIRFFLCLAIGCGSAVAAPGASQGTCSPIVVVTAVEGCSVSERAYAASLAKRTRDWLVRGGVKADLADDCTLEAVLAKRRLAYFVTWQTPMRSHLAAVQRFCARGGKIAVLHSFSPTLAAWMGVPVPTPVQGGAIQVVARPNGWWFPNFFAVAATEDAKMRSLLVVAGTTVPGSWQAAAWDARQRAQRMAEMAYGRQQVRRPGEIHAVWDHSGQGLYPGDWGRTLRLLKESHVTDLFVNVAGAGFAHYPSQILPRSRVCTARGDQLAACLAAAHGMGIRVHAWVICFNATRATPTQMLSFTKRRWRLARPTGELTEYLDPANAHVRWYLLQAIEEIAKRYPVDGVQLDFIRWYEGARKPKQAAEIIQGFVGAVRSRVRVARPQAWLTAAVLATYPSCRTSVGQDWPTWVESGLVDYVVPMNYVADLKKYNSYVQQQGTVPRVARHTISGIGVTANESRLTACQVIDQVNSARRAGLAGVALFDLNPTLVESILPVLRAGQF